MITIRLPLLAALLAGLTLTACQRDEDKTGAERAADQMEDAGEAAEDAADDAADAMRDED